MLGEILSIVILILSRKILRLLTSTWCLMPSQDTWLFILVGIILVQWFLIIIILSYNRLYYTPEIVTLMAYPRSRNEEALRSNYSPDNIDRLIQGPYHVLVQEMLRMTTLFNLATLNLLGHPRRDLILQFHRGILRLI